MNLWQSLNKLTKISKKRTYGGLESPLTSGDVAEVLAEAVELATPDAVAPDEDVFSDEELVAEVPFRRDAVDVDVVEAIEELDDLKKQFWRKLAKQNCKR